MATPAADLSVVFDLMLAALPIREPADKSPDVTNSYELVALLLHARLISLGFRFHSLDEPKMPLSPTPYPLAGSRLPSRWNADVGAIGFRYFFKLQPDTILVRVDLIGSKIEVRGLVLDRDESIYRLQWPVRTLVDGCHLPIRYDADDAIPPSDFQLRRAFVSQDAIIEFLGEFDFHVAEKILHDIEPNVGADNDDGQFITMAETLRRIQVAHESGNRWSRLEPETEGPPPLLGLLPDMARPRPAAPMGDFPPPDFEDEHQMQRPSRPGVVFPGGRSPYNIGHDDLHPPALGPRDPFTPSLTSPALLPGHVPASGMHPTFDDPLFDRQGPRGQAPPAAYDPQLPPGARWDPIGPGGRPRFPGPGPGDGSFGGGGSSFGGGAPGFGGII